MKKVIKSLLICCLIFLLTFFLVRVSTGSYFGKETLDNYPVEFYGYCAKDPDNLPCGFSYNGMKFDNDSNLKIPREFDPSTQALWSEVIGRSSDKNYKICGYTKNFSHTVTIAVSFKDKTSEKIVINKSSNNCIETKGREIEVIKYESLELYPELAALLATFNDAYWNGVPGPINDQRIRDLAFEIILRKETTIPKMLFTYLIAFLFSVNICASFIQIVDWCLGRPRIKC